MSQQPSAPRKRPPTYNGIRVGGLAGALIGGGLLIFTGFLWWVPIGAALGAVVGHFQEKSEAGN